MNRISIIGLVGREYEISRKFINFTIAVNEKWIDKATNERKESREWIKVVIYNNYVIKSIKDSIKKGSKVFIGGLLKTRSWEGEDKKKNYITEVVVGNQWQLLVSSGSPHEEKNIDD